jgi:hypothetical protein
VFKKPETELGPQWGVNRRISEDWLEKNPSGFFDFALRGGGKHRKWGG